MPLSGDVVERVLGYCDAHLPPHEWFLGQFDFIDDEGLRNRIAIEFYSARYIYKLGSALFVDGVKLYSHVKFQIVQYASIYEAVIVYLLFEKFKDHEAVLGISFHSAIKKTSQFPKDITVTNSSGEELFLCSEKTTQTPIMSIKFDDKVEAAVLIGFISEALGEEIKELYKLRNAIHIETAVKKNIEYDLEQSKIAYRRMRLFVRGIRKFLNGEC